MSRNSGFPPKTLDGPGTNPKRYVTRDEMMTAIAKLARVYDEKMKAYHVGYVEPLVKWVHQLAPLVEWAQLPADERNASDPPLVGVSPMPENPILEPKPEEFQA